MRTHSVKKAQKDQGTCLKCHKPIKAGDTYAWLKGRHGPRKVVCAACHFSDSDRTGSDKLARVYDARDAAQEAVSKWATEDDLEDLKTVLTECAEALREVAQEYQDSADNIHQNFSESSTADDCEEKANEIEGYADEVAEAADNMEEFDEDNVREEAVEDFDMEEARQQIEQERRAPTALPMSQEQEDAFIASRIADLKRVHIEDTVRDKRNDWGEEMRDAAEAAIGNCPV